MIPRSRQIAELRRKAWHAFIANTLAILPSILTAILAGCSRPDNAVGRTVACEDKEARVELTAERIALFSHAEAPATVAMMTAHHALVAGFDRSSIFEISGDSVRNVSLPVTGAINALTATATYYLVAIDHRVFRYTPATAEWDKFAELSADIYSLAATLDRVWISSRSGHDTRLVVLAGPDTSGRWNVNVNVVTETNWLLLAAPGSRYALATDVRRPLSFFLLNDSAQITQIHVAPAMDDLLADVDGALGMNMVPVGCGKFIRIVTNPYIDARWAVLIDSAGTAIRSKRLRERMGIMTISGDGQYFAGARDSQDGREILRISYVWKLDR